MYTCHRPTLLRLLCIFKTHVLHYLYNSKLLILTWHFIPFTLLYTWHTKNYIQCAECFVFSFFVRIHFRMSFINQKLIICKWILAKKKCSRRPWFRNVKLKRSYDYKHKYFKLAGDIRFQMHFADIL